MASPPPEPYHWVLRCMAKNGSSAGSPGKIFPDYYLPMTDAGNDILFVCKDGVASFEPHEDEDKNLKPRGTKAWFFGGETQLMIEPYTRVYIESPPHPKLPPRDPNRRTSVPPNRFHNVNVKLHIYLRPGDIVHFEEDGYAILIDAVSSPPPSQPQGHAANELPAAPSGDLAANLTEIQVKSSAKQPSDSDARGAEDESDTDEDAGAPAHTLSHAKDVTPATSRPIDALAVQDTPVRPASRDSNALFSTAPDNLESGTPADRVRPISKKRAKAQQDDDSQNVFPDAFKGQKYGGTPRGNRRSLPKEVSEPPTGSGEDVPVSPSSLKRKYADEELVTTMAPPAKKQRGRPIRSRKSPKGAPIETSEPTNVVRTRPKQASEALTDAEIAPASTSGKLKKLSRRSVIASDPMDDDNDASEVAVVIPRGNTPPDLNSRTSSTPQSSGAPLIGTAPTKILLSRSRFAEDAKAKKWLQKHNITIEEDVPGKRSSFICVVGTGELPLTAKVMRSLACGKSVVTDEWLADSMSANQLLDLQDYIHDDLAETISIDRSKLFGGQSLFFTNALKTSYQGGFADIEQLAKETGARMVEFGTSHKAHGRSAAHTIILGAVGGDTEDNDALKLTKQHERVVYQKDMLTQSIIRGRLLRDEEFVWTPAAKKGRKGKKK